MVSLPEHITAGFLDLLERVDEETAVQVVGLMLMTAEAFDHADTYARVERYARLEPALRRMARKLTGWDDGDRELEAIAGAIYLLRENGRDEGEEAVIEVLESFGCEEARQMVGRHWHSADFLVRRNRVARPDRPLAEELAR